MKSISKSLNRTTTITILISIIFEIVVIIITKNVAYISSIIWTIAFFILHRVNIIQDKHNDYLFNELMDSYKYKLIAIKFFSKICDIVNDNENTEFIAKQDLMNAMNEYINEYEKNKEERKREERGKNKMKTDYNEYNKQRIEEILKKGEYCGVNILIGMNENNAIADVKINKVTLYEIAILISTLQTCIVSLTKKYPLAAEAAKNLKYKSSEFYTNDKG